MILNSFQEYLGFPSDILVDRRLYLLYREVGQIALFSIRSARCVRFDGPTLTARAASAKPRPH